MKYCSHCGKQINDEAVICTGCGCMVEDNKTKNNKLDIQNSEICSPAYLWTWFVFYLLSFICGSLSLFYDLLFRYRLFSIVLAIISIITFIPSIIMSIIGINKGWKHYYWGSKAYPVNFIGGCICSVLGVIFAILALIIII